MTNPTSSPARPELTTSEWFKRESEIIEANLLLGYKREVAVDLARHEMHSKYRYVPVGG